MSGCYECGLPGYSDPKLCPVCANVAVLSERATSMSRDNSYKKQDDVIVTVPMTPALHKRLRIKCIHENITIKAFVTKLIEDNCP